MPFDQPEAAFVRYCVGRSRTSYANSTPFVGSYYEMGQERPSRALNLSSFSELEGAETAVYITGLMGATISSTMLQKPMSFPGRGPSRTYKCKETVHCLKQLERLTINTKIWPGAARIRVELRRLSHFLIVKKCYREGLFVRMNRGSKALKNSPSSASTATCKSQSTPRSERRHITPFSNSQPRSNP